MSKNNNDYKGNQREHKNYYHNSVINEIHRKMYYKPNFMIAKIEYIDQSDQPTAENKLDEHTDKLNEHTDKQGGALHNNKHNDNGIHEIHEYKHKTLSLFLKYFENMHFDIGIYGIISRYILSNQNITWTELRTYMSYITDRYQLVNEQPNKVNEQPNKVNEQVNEQVNEESNKVNEQVNCCVSNTNVCFARHIHGDVLCVGNADKYTKLANADNKVTESGSKKSDNKVTESGSKVTKLHIHTDETKDKSYNTIIISNCLHHVNEPKDTLLHYKKLLAPNGIIIIEDIVAEDIKHKGMYDILHQLQYDYFKIQKDTTYHGMDDIKKIIHDNGMIVVDETEQNHSYYLIAKKHINQTAT
jgi:hypothetical protein